MLGFKKQVLTILISLLIAFALFAWEKNYGTDANDYGNSVCEDICRDGGFAIAGTTEYSEDNSDAFLVSVDPDGNVEWNYNYGSPESLEISYDIEQTGDGGFIVCGEVWPHETFMDHCQKGFILKTDYAGNVDYIFHKVAGFRTYSSLTYSPMNAKITLTGWVKTVGSIYKVLWRQYDAGGKILGPGQGGEDSTYLLDGHQHAEGHCIQKVVDGYIIVGGIWQEYVDAGLQNCDIYLIKTTETGVASRQLKFGEIDKDEIGYYVQPTYDGGCVIVGGVWSNSLFGWDIYLIKCKKQGYEIIKEWERIYGGTRDDIGYGVQQTPDSGYIICGTSQSFSADGRDEIYFLRVDKFGNKIFEKTFGKPQFHCYGSSIKLTSDGGYILVGTERYSGDVPINKGDEVYCVYGEPLNAPTLLCFNPVVYEGLAIHWLDNSTNEIRFEIDRKIGDAGSWTTIGTSNANVTSYCDTDISSHYGQDVYYRVRAVSEFNSSSPSNEIKVKIPGPGIFSDTIRAAVDYYHSSRNLFRDNSGNYHLVLKHHKRIWYTKSTNNGQTWSLARSLAWSGPEAPSVVATSTGLPCFIWQENSGTVNNPTCDLIYAYIDAQGNIHKITLVDNANHDLSPTIAITSDDQIFVAFIHTYSSNGKIICLKFAYNNPQYSICCEFTGCYQPMHVRMTVDNSNYPHLVWDEYHALQYQSWWREVRRIWHGWFTGSNPLKEIVDEGWLTDGYPHVVKGPVINCSGTTVQVSWMVFVSNTPNEIFYRAKSTGGWGPTINVTQASTLGDHPGLPRIISGKVLCLANNKIYVTYPYNPYEARMLVDGVIVYDAIPTPSGTMMGATAIVYSKWTGVPNLFQVCFTIKTIPCIPPYKSEIAFSSPGLSQEFTVYNNSRRLIRDANGILHLAFTSGNNIYHTFLQDTSWAEPEFVAQGMYPSLLSGDGKLYSIYAHNEPYPTFLEELRFAKKDATGWTVSDFPVAHTCNSFLWGIGAPSFAMKDTIGYFVFESTYGPTYHPEPGGAMPMVITLQGTALIYGGFPINHPEDCQWQILEELPWGPIPFPVDTIVYRDSILPGLISPSITVDNDGVVHILWEGRGDSLRYYRIIDTIITREFYPGNGIDYPFITMREDQIDHFWCDAESIK